MTERPPCRRLALAVLLLIAATSATAEPPWDALMPRVEDRTSMVWAEGFPDVAPEAPWHRVIETGRFAFVLDTESLAVPHFGPLPATAAESTKPSWTSLPAAELDLAIEVNGQTWYCRGANPWTRHSGPRLIESGRFFQRGDITDLVFENAAGEKLAVDARLETAAWSDRLGLILLAQPGVEPIPPGEAAFGKVGGGLGFDGDFSLAIDHAEDLDPEEFSIEFHAFVPNDYRVSDRVWPWLICKNHNEAADGNFGIMIVDDVAQGRLNIGGGREGQVVVGERKVALDAWNHLVLSYDGESLRLYLNGQLSGEEKVGRTRKPGQGPLVLGRRADNHGDGYRFRGVIDEFRLYSVALDLAQMRQRLRQPNREIDPVGAWSFRHDGEASETQPLVSWINPTLSIALTSGGKTIGQQQPGDRIALVLDPVAFVKDTGTSPVVVNAGERPVAFDAGLGWHRINLDGLEPVVPDGATPNDAMERVRFRLQNPTADEQVARLMFEKTSGGIRQRIGSPITGISAVLRDANGEPTGIPVQLSKNWHARPDGGPFASQWFHGISQVRLPPKSDIELELVVAYGHWGGVAAASHAQLSLIGWGGNQRWDQSALGAWGESICYDPEQAQAAAIITDVRPLMVRSMSDRGDGRWNWTNNVGGGDFFRLFDRSGERVAHTAMDADYLRHGPCLTEVRYTGNIGADAGLSHSFTASLGRSDDLVRGSYRIRLDVEKSIDVSRFVIFQVGADTYNPTRETGFAVGHANDLVTEWPSRPGGDGYRGRPVEAIGDTPWVSLHNAAPRDGKAATGAWANRGIVIREWSARLGGQAAAPWFAEHATTQRGGGVSTIDIVPPPGVSRLEAGDFVEATLEYIVVPRSADDYYGPNDALRAALQRHGNTWRMIHREAAGNDRRVEMRTGTVERRHPDVRVRCENDSADFTINGGLGHVPITFTGLASHRGYVLTVDGEVVDQSVHENDFWQCDFDPSTRQWSRTYNLPLAADRAHRIRFFRQP